MEIGVSTACLYPLETEQALKELCERGIKTVEIFINSPDELDGEIFSKLYNTAREYDVKVRAVHPFSSPLETLFLFGNYKRRVDFLMDLYCRYFDRMNKLGAKLFVLHGALQSGNIPDDRYFERYLTLYRKAQEFGITVAQENICYCKSRNPEFLEKMSQQLGDEVRFVLDLKQARRSNVDAFQLLDMLGEKIVHLHVSDGNSEKDCLPIGDGCFDFDRLLDKLDSLGYDNAMIVELYRENYTGYDALRISADRLQNIVSNRQNT